MSRSPGRRGLLLILSSPSGAGKTTMTRRLLAEDRGIALSVSATTRPPRPGEVDGRDYHFVGNDRFDAMVAAGDFLEWAEVFGNRYGTPRAPVLAALAEGRDILFDIDWQGARQIREGRGDGEESAPPVSIFLLPPDMVELERRLHARAADSDTVIRQRMERAAEEVRHWAEYAYVLVNDDPDQCLSDIRSILDAERLRRERQPDLAGFVDGLLGEATARP